MLFPTRLPVNNQYLSTREAQVLWLCADGLTAQQMAERLGVSIRTINRHRDNIRQRFSLKGYYALHQFALKNKPELAKWKISLDTIENITHFHG